MPKYLLLGNPNVGKTTIFNKLTGKNEKISNFEGVTVQKKEAVIKNTSQILLDLPGINNLLENIEIVNITKKYLYDDAYSNIIYTANINSLKKNMYLLLDLCESGKNIELILTNMDLFKGNINLHQFKEKLNLNIQTSTNDNQLNFAQMEFSTPNLVIKYPQIIENLIIQISSKRNQKSSTLNTRFLALQLIKNDFEVYQYFDDVVELRKQIKIIEQEIITNKQALSITGILFKTKREFIMNLLKDNYTYKITKKRSDITTRLDSIFMHKYLGIIIFFAIMLLVFTISFEFLFLGDIISSIYQIFVDQITLLLAFLNFPQILTSFIIDGILAGFGGIIVFLPQIIILFTLLTFLEATGYLVRVSVLFENLFAKVGLSAHSLIPLISGLGCNVLSIMSTKTIKNEKKKISTILAAPFISCSARLPIYIIFIQIFFDQYEGLILFSLYLLGILVALLVSYVTDKLILKDKDEFNILSLPEYKIMSSKYFWRILKAKIKGFILGAGKLILVGTIIIWIITHIGINGFTMDPTQSIIYNIADALKHLFTPLGFGTVESTMSLLAAFLAKELAVSSLIVFYQTDISGINSILAANFTGISAYSFMVFTLLYIPCISTLGAMYGEIKNIKIVLISVIISFGIAYTLSFLVYNLGNLIF